MVDLALVYALVVLHGPDGREINVSPGEIASIHCKMPDRENKMFVEGVNAIINTTDGKYVSVVETCSDIRDMLKR